MGESTIWSLSADPETEQIVARWQREFSPLVGSNRSRLVCMALKTLDRLGFTAERLIEALNAPQRLRLENAEQSLANLNNTSQDFPVLAAPEGRAKPLTRINASSKANPGARGREVRGVSRLSGDVEMVAWDTSFPLNSTRVMRWAA